MIEIFLVDDHHLVRQALRAVLESETDFSVVGEAANGLDTIRLVQELKPDVLILDLMIPSLSGLEVVRQISRNQQATRILILSMHSDESYVVEALKNGALGYVLKSSDSFHLKEAIRSVASGKRYLSPPLSDLVIDLYLKRSQDATLDKYERLTTREREVLQLVSEGLTNAEVATQLHISTRTVEVHRASLMRKLDLHNHADLVRFVLTRTNQH